MNDADTRLRSGTVNNFIDAMDLMAESSAAEEEWLRASGRWDDASALFFRSYNKCIERARLLYEVGINAALLVIIQQVRGAYAHRKQDAIAQGRDPRFPFDPESLFAELANALESGDYTGLTLTEEEE